MVFYYGILLWYFIMVFYYGILLRGGILFVLGYGVGWIVITWGEIILQN